MKKETVPVKAWTMVRQIPETAVKRWYHPIYQHQDDHGKIILDPLIWLDQINHHRKDQGADHHKCSMQKAVTIVQRYLQAEMGNAQSDHGGKNDADPMIGYKIIYAYLRHKGEETEKDHKTTDTDRPLVHGKNTPL